MTPQEFENTYASIRLKLKALAFQFRKAASAEIDPDDIVQEALTALWELSEKGCPIRNPEALLVRITKNICISSLRKQKIKTGPILDDNVSGGETASADTDRMDEALIKDRLYECLTRTERQYMLMKTEENLSLDEISQRTGNPKSGIKTAISKAKKKLKEQFVKNGYDR